MTNVCDSTARHRPALAPRDAKPTVIQRVRWACRRGMAHLLCRALGPVAVRRGHPSGETCHGEDLARFGILMYHRVAPTGGSYPAPTYNVPPDRFRRQMAGLLAAGYRPKALGEVLRYRREGTPLPPSTFVVTFDDAFACVLQHALPILKELAIPATVFVATAYLDSPAPAPFDDWSAAGRDDVPREAWRVATTDECRQLQRSGLIELGCHTHTHGDFRARPGAFADDVHQSLDVLHERFDVSDPPLAFPFGVYDGAMVETARELGLPCSLTTRGRQAQLNDDPHRWGRFTPEPYDTAGTLAARLSGWYERVWHPWERRAAPIGNPRPTSAPVEPDHHDDASAPPQAERSGEPQAERSGKPQAERSGKPQAERSGEPQAERSGEPQAEPRGKLEPSLSRGGSRP